MTTLLDKGIIKLGKYEFPQENRLFQEKDVKEAVEQLKEKFNYIYKTQEYEGELLSEEELKVYMEWIKEIFGDFEE